MSDPANTSTSPTPGSPLNDAAAAASPNPNEPFAFPLRALITSRDAGVIIGKGGKNVADLREAAGVKAGVSKAVIPNGNGATAGVPPVSAQERILSVSGPLEGVAKAYFLVAQAIAENPLSPQIDSPTLSSAAANRAIRFLVSHNLMGSIIGKEGKKIKEIQDRSGARVVAHKDMLPQSTERVVEVSGSPEAIQQAVLAIGRCLIDDWDRGQGTVLYQPGAAQVLVTADGIPVAGNGLGLGYPSGAGGYGRRTSSGFSTGGYQRRTSTGGEFRSTSDGPRRPSNTLGGGGVGAAAAVASAGASTSAPVPTPSDANLRTQNISIPSDMVGCIIGKGGAKINDIRRVSGSRISIAKVPHDETGERMFTITGTSEANEKALYLLYSSLESEKDRRASVQEEDA